MKKTNSILEIIIDIAEYLKIVVLFDQFSKAESQLRNRINA